MDASRKIMDYPLGVTLRKMLQNVTKQNPSLYGYFALYTAAASLYPFLAVLLPGFMIEELQKGMQANVRTVLLIPLVYFVLASVLGFLRTYIQNTAYNPITRLRIDYVRDTSVKLMEMAYPNAEDAHFMEKYEKAMTANQSNNNGTEGVYHKLFELPALLVTVLILSVVIGGLSPLILLGLFLNMAVTVRISQKAHAFRYAHKEEEAKWNRKISYYNDVTSDFTYGKDIRMFGMKRRILENYNAEIQGYANLQNLLAQREYRYSFWGLATLLLSDGLVYGILTVRALNGMSIASFSMYLTAAITMSVYLKQAAEGLVFIINEGQYVYEFYKFMETDMGEKGGNHPAVSDDTLEIVFDDVSFRYPGAEQYVFSHLNFTIHKGERLAIVGINGAGKSTLVKLMTGLFPVTEGQIRINGVPLEEYDRKALYSMYSVVFQESHIMAFNVNENIACSSENIDEERVEKALQKVGMSEKIHALPRKREQMLLKVIEEDGALFSGGEQQKLTIARALYKDAPMVIMDEPTAALDALAEAEIYENFNRLAGGRTAFYISHRMSSSVFCDKILVIDGGRITDFASHEELMKKTDSLYYKLFKSQAENYAG